MKNKEKET